MTISCIIKDLQVPTVGLGISPEPTDFSALVVSVDNIFPSEWQGDFVSRQSKAMVSSSARYLDIGGHDNVA